MEVINIQKFKNNFNIVVKSGLSNQQLKESRNYYPDVGKMLVKNQDLYKENYIVDLVLENSFFTMLGHALEYKNVMSLKKTAEQVKLLKNSFILNDKMMPKENVSQSLSEYNKKLRNKTIGFCIVEYLKDLRYCKRLIKDQNIHHIIVLKPIEEDRDLIDYILKQGYSDHSITEKGNIRTNLNSFYKYPLLLKANCSKVSDGIVVRFD